jgi:hypothetical protein
MKIRGPGLPLIYAGDSPPKSAKTRWDVHVLERMDALMKPSFHNK